MRCTITTTLKGRETIPVNYQYSCSAEFYLTLQKGNAEYAQFLHAKAEHKKNLKVIQQLNEEV